VCLGAVALVGELLEEGKNPADFIYRPIPQTAAQANVDPDSVDANNGVVVAPEGDNLILSVADAEFIAAARTDIPALISEIRRLEQAYLEALRMVGDAIGLLGEMSEP